MQGDAIKDANGLPPNIKPPRDKPMWERRITRTGQPWYVVRVDVDRQRYEDIEREFSGGAFIHRWWSVSVKLYGFGGLLHVWRWHERWAV